MGYEKSILLLGAGKVTGPLVGYLLEKTSFPVTVASRTLSKAEKLVGGNPRGKAISLLVEEEKDLEKAISDSSLVISMLPWTHHLKVANLCLKLKKHLITTSYAKPEMKALDEEVKRAGLIFLNEIGVDPGIDHMSAMKIIERIRGKGGKILSFISLCGGLPAPSANDNPWGYKFSWSPKGVALAGKNSASFLRAGTIINLPAEKLFLTVLPLKIPGLGDFEVYPNRDSISYKTLYNIPEAKTMFRGTIRYPGWCRSWDALRKMGFLREEPIKTKGKTYREFTAGLIKAEPEKLENKLADFLGINPDDDIIRRFSWLRLFSDEKIPREQISPIDLLVSLMEEQMSYKEGEQDMIIMLHQFIAEYPGKVREKITSILETYGQRGGDTAMAVTVGTPPAIAAKLILEGKIKQRGVLIPTISEIYLPVLKEMEKAGVVFKEENDVDFQI